MDVSTTDIPTWLDRHEYPFKPHYFETAHGRLHYVDVGSGRPIVMVHGTPTWSFLWRRFVKALSPTYRVIAPDHLGFGLSDKSEDTPYRPENHAQRLRTLIDHLRLDDIALVVHDFGGPIGLSYAVDRPDNVRAITLFNTWMWSREDDPATRRASRLLGSRLGQLLYRRLNLSPRVLLRAAFGDRAKLTEEVHRHYLRPFPDARSRTAPWVFARELVGSSAWYDSLWVRRSALKSKPALILWGEKDPAFGDRDLERWRRALPHASVRVFPDAGHFVQEEAPETASEAVLAFLRKVDQDAASEGA